MATFQQRSQMKATMSLRRRISQWNLWNCDLDTLKRMQAEVEQEMLKLDAKLRLADRDFERLLTAADPITIEQTRALVESLGEKWDILRKRGLEIDDAIREKTLAASVNEFGQNFGLGDLYGLLQNVRVLALLLSLLAAAIPLIVPFDLSVPGSLASLQQLDLIHLLASVFLTADFLGRLPLVDDRGTYFQRRRFDIALSLPLVTIATLLFPYTTPLGTTIAQFARLLTMQRIGRFIRLSIGERIHLRSIRFLRSVEFTLLARTVIIGVFMLAVGSLIVTNMEQTRAQSEAFNTLDKTLWWGAKIILTANIDGNPDSPLGRVVTLGMVLVGLSVSGVVIATITSILVDTSDERNTIERQQQDMNDKLLSIRENLDLLTNAKAKAASAAALLAHAVTTQPDRKTVMEKITRGLVEQFGCLQASIHMVDESRRVVVREATFGEEVHTPAEVCQFDEGLVGRTMTVARRGEVEALPDLQMEPLPLADGGAVCIPLAMRRVGYGVLHVICPEAWLRDDLIQSLLTILASTLAEYLHDHETSQAHDGLMASVSDLQATMERVTTTRDYDALLFAIAGGASALLNADMSKVMLLDADKGELRGVAWHGMPDELGKALYTRVGDGLTGIAAQTGRAIKSSNLLTDQRVTATSSQARRSGMRSELCVPIIAGGTLLGVLAVMSKEHKRFSREDETLLGTLAGQAGAAMENARIYAIEQRRFHIADTMQEISSKLNESLNERDTLTVVLDQLFRVVRYDSASILLVEGEELRLAVGAGFQDEAQWETLRFRVKEHKLFQQMRDTLEPIVIADVQEYDGWLAGPMELRSWLGVPLIVTNRVIGLLSVDRQTIDSFDAEDVQIAQRFATQAALAVRNAGMYRALMECEGRQA